MLTTPRRAIPYPNPDRSDRPDIPLHIYNVAIAADGDVIYDQGTSASRGSAIHETSGGRLWWETDTDLLWYDDGTSWFSVGVNPAGSLTFTGTTSQIVFNGENNAGNTVIRANVTGDAFSRFAISTNGKISWGNGAAALDTFLYRSAVGVLNTDGSLIVGTAENVSLGTGNATATRNAAGSVTWQSRVVGDVFARLQILADGSMKWGSGAAATDVSLARIGANNLALGTSTQRGIFSIYGNAAANTGLQSLVTTDTQSRFQLRYDGGLNWGPGNAATDTNLYRSSAANLKTDGSFTSGTAITAGTSFLLSGAGTYAARNQSASATVTLGTRLTADTVDRYEILADGKLQWGPGNVAVDTNLYRSTTNQLKTDGSFIVSQGLAIGSFSQLSATSLGSLELTASGQVTIALTDTGQVSPAGRWQIYNAADSVRVWRSSVGDIFSIDGANHYVFVNANYPLVQHDGTTSMRVMRHPYVDHEHIENATVSFTTSTSGSASVTFTNPFASTPRVTAMAHDTAVCFSTAVSTTGFTLNAYLGAGSSRSVSYDWHTVGGD